MYLYELIRNSSYDYTRQFCLEQAYQKHVLAKCECVDAYYVSLFDSILCSTNKTKSQCASDEYLRYVEEIDKQYLSMCPLECNFLQYKHILSSYQLAGDAYYKKIKKNKNLSEDFVTEILSKETAATSVISVNIFYGSLSYMESKESPKMTLVSLLALIGGNLSLFLGISLISLFELIELLIEIFNEI